MFFFTSITLNYLAKARVLCKTLLEHNSDAKMVLMLNEPIPDYLKVENELFYDILTIDDIDEVDNVDIFRFKYNVTEICTAVKPAAARKIIEKHNAQKVVYLDPDIVVYDSFHVLNELLDNHSIVLTPHTTKYDEDPRFIVGNEILFLKKGTMNCGFFAVSNSQEGIEFLNWWSKRTLQYALDDKLDALFLMEPNGLLGLFTDQKWVDLVPSFFDNYYILKHPGYNVSTWNLTNRTVTKKENKYFINDKELVFFHFSSFDSRHHHIVLDIICEIKPENKIVKELSSEYSNMLDRNGEKELKKIQYHFSCYTNGKVITDFERRVFNVRKDLYNVFTNPFEIKNQDYFSWIRGEYSEFFDENGEYVKNIKFKEVAASLSAPSPLLYRILRKIYRKFIKKY